MMPTIGGVARTTAIAVALTATCGMLLSHAQGVAGGQSRATRGAAAGCQEGSTEASDPNCTEGAPGFAAPMLDAVPDSPRAVTALVRVDAIMKRPPVALPSGNSFTVVGTATVIRVRRADQAACLATGKRISARVNAGTSTTCLDQHGELLAVEECAAGAPDCAVLLAADVARQQMPGPRP